MKWTCAQLPLFALSAFTACLIAATLLTPGYSHVEQVVSALAAPDAPHPWVMASGFALYGVMMLPLGLSLCMWLRYHGRPASGVAAIVLVALYGSSGLFVAFFPDDPLGEASTAGAIHDAIARLGSSGILGTIALIAIRAWSLPGERGFFATTIAWVQFASILLRRRIESDGI